MDLKVGKQMLILLDELREKNEFYTDSVNGALLSLLLMIIRFNPGDREQEPMTYHNRYLADIFKNSGIYGCSLQRRNPH